MNRPQRRHASVGAGRATCGGGGVWAGALPDGRVVFVGQRQEVEQRAHITERLDVVVGRSMRDAGLDRVCLGAAELLLCDLLVGDL